LSSQLSDTLPSAVEVHSFIEGLCHRADIPLSKFFQQYWIEERHISRLPFLLHRIAPLLSPASTLLDVGSFGEWPLLLWRFLGMANVSACSLEGGYLAYASGELKKHEELGKQFELHIQQIDIENQLLPRPDSSLDVITCFEVLEHLRCDPMFVMKEFNRVLRPNGLLILSTPNVGSYEGILRIINGGTPHIFSQYFPERRGIGHVKEYAVSEVRELFLNSGFEIDALESFDYHPPIGLDPSVITKFEPLRESLRQFGWSQDLAKQTMLIVARRTDEPRYRYYSPLYTVTVPAEGATWLASM
jgi:SAM-dependent methyltransferase